MRSEFGFESLLMCWFFCLRTKLSENKTSKGFALKSVHDWKKKFTVEINWFMFPGIIFFTSGSFALLVTNHPLSQLFPKATAFIVVLRTCVFQASNSVFRLWQILFDAGLPFKLIVSITLSFTLVHWARTFFLMPFGWVNKDIAPFYQSPFRLKVRLLYGHLAWK